MDHRATQSLSARSGRAGFTLVELLVALVIAVLIASVLVALYGIATRTVFDQQARARGPHAASTTLDLMADDLGRAILQAVATNDFFVLENGGTNQPPGVTASLSFCTLDPLQDTTPDWHLARRVTYRVETEGQPAPALLRIHQPLTGPGSVGDPVTNVLVREVDTFSIELFDGSDWQSTWVGKAGDSRRPKIARVVINSTAWKGASPLQRADLMIPAGHSVTSTVIRQSSAPSS